MSRQKLLVGLLLSLASDAIFFCSAGVLDSEKQTQVTLQPSSFLQRTTFPPLPPSNLIPAVPYSRSEAPFTHGNSQLADRAHAPSSASPAKVKTRTETSEPLDSQVTGYVQEKTTVIPKMTPKNPTQPTGQSTIHRNATVFKSTAAALKTTSKPDPVSSPEMTGSAQTTAAETTFSYPMRLSYHTPAAQKTERTTFSKATSVLARNRTVAPMSTASSGPVLTPKPLPAATGAYSVSNGTAACIKVLTGLTMIIRNSKTKNLEYFNIDPNITHTSGSCGNSQGTLNITFQGGFIRFGFGENGEVYYISLIEATLRAPSESSPYYGIQSQLLFATPVGRSFKCLSPQTVKMANNLQLLVSNSQLQAFNIVGNQFGKEEECTLDRRKQAIPAAVGLSLAGLLVIALVTCVIYKRKPNRGYERI